MASELPTVKKIIGTIEEVTEKMSKQGVSYKSIVINTEGNGCIITTYFDNESFTLNQLDLDLIKTPFSIIRIIYLF